MNNHGGFATTTYRIKGRPFHSRAYSAKVDFASDESGCRIVASSQSLSHVSSILNNDRNLYMLAPCRKGDWLILSFPESISIEKIVFLSYEYYASTYKYISVSASDVYPANKWTVLAEVVTSPSLNEIFDISKVCSKLENSGCWAKFLRIDLLDYHSVEENYYCSLTKIKVYGSTAVEVLENETNEDTKSKSAVDVASQIGICPVTSEMSKPSTKTVEAPLLEQTQIPQVKPVTVEQRFYHDVDKITLDTCWKYMSRWKSCAPPLHYGFNPAEYTMSPVRMFRGNNCNPSKCPKASSQNFEWFYNIINQFSLKRNLESNLRYMCTDKYIPVLVCDAKLGVWGISICYYHFHNSSHFTFVATRKMFNYHPTKRLKQRTFFLLFSDDCLYEMKPMNTMYTAERCCDGLHVQYKFSDFPVSYISISKHSMKVTTISHSLSRIEPAASHLSNIGNYLSNNETLITEATRHLNPILKILQSDTNRAGETSENTSRNMDQKRLEKIFESLTRATPPKIDSEETEQQSPQYKKGSANKHVLVKLSERVKELELFSNQLSTRLLENRELFEAYFLDFSRKSLASKDAIKLLNNKLRRMTRWIHEIGDVVGLQQHVVIYRNLTKKSSGTKYTSKLHTMVRADYTNKDFAQNYCHIYSVKPHVQMGPCFKTFMVMRISYYLKVLYKFRLLECCKRFGCTCPYNDWKSTSPFLIWMPHFVRKHRHCGVLYLIAIPFIRQIKWLARIIWWLAAIASRVIFNHYTITILFIASQALWMYRDHCTRQMILNHCARPCKCSS
ncbi:bifunctional SUN domain-containing Suco-Slp1-like/SUN domain/Galactose-binding-like domain superfamily [Babesia duncani]|uniref:Bifunctional SUN domain-containing Suco-Slp1-like/SUN domain/Galactose-binding-like domain superfamily n=1 Tax=Babesia duncani TaxID=323732 RepID=A0AAD9PMS2_9APIC|nr:bifunctional SUN domain-containing Suco-Slp1-like/SUN domain/Galactose-binding-like domain superfamily [Babesia duncani]